MTTRKSTDYKLTAVNYYLVEDKTQDEVCKIFKCSRRSLMRWVDRYENDGNVDIHYRKPVAYKVKKEYVNFLLQELKKNKTITMQDLLEKLKEKYPTLTLSRFHLNRIVNDNNITLKITRIRHEPNKRFGKDIDINKKIKEFYDEVKKYKMEDIICIDERLYLKSKSDENLINKFNKSINTVAIDCVECYTCQPNNKILYTNDYESTINNCDCNKQTIDAIIINLDGVDYYKHILNNKKIYYIYNNALDIYTKISDYEIIDTLNKL